MNNEIIVAMVLKSGGIYDFNYVNNLNRAILRNTTLKIKIVCLTDNSAGFDSNIKSIPLVDNFPKWWSKIELFRPDLFPDQKVFFMDLDTVIIGNVDSILSFNYDFCALSDFYKIVTLGSGLMAWHSSEKTNKIYNDFIKNSITISKNYLEGDQQWIEEKKPLRTKYFQDLFPNQIISFKKHCLLQNGSINIPSQAKIICFHGLPKPHTILDPAIKDHWG